MLSSRVLLVVGLHLGSVSILVQQHRQKRLTLLWMEWTDLGRLREAQCIGLSLRIQMLCVAREPNATWHPSLLAWLVGMQYLNNFEQFFNNSLWIPEMIKYIWHWWVSHSCATFDLALIGATSFAIIHWPKNSCSCTWIWHFKALE